MKTTKTLIKITENNLNNNGKYMSVRQIEV